MTPRNLYATAAFILLLLSTLSYAQTATCTGWKTFMVANEWNTRAYGINSYGTVVGGTAGPYGSTTPAPAFVRYSNGSISTFRYQNQFTTFSRRNAQGVSVGYYENSSGHYHGIVVSGSNVVTVNYPNASDTFPLGINYWGTIVGYYLLPGSINTHGFEFKNGQFISIKFPNSVDTIVESINDSSVMVGSEWPGSGVYEGFVLKNGTFVTVKDPKASGATFPTDINNVGTIVGDYISGVNPHSFMYISGVFKDIAVPNATQAKTNGVNGSNYVTGEAIASNGSSSGFIAHCQ